MTTKQTNMLLNFCYTTVVGSELNCFRISVPFLFCPLSALFCHGDLYCCIFGRQYIKMRMRMVATISCDTSRKAVLYEKRGT